MRQRATSLQHCIVRTWIWRFRTPTFLLAISALAWWTYSTTPKGTNLQSLSVNAVAVAFFCGVISLIIRAVFLHAPLRFILGWLLYTFSNVLLIFTSVYYSIGTSANFRPELTKVGAIDYTVGTLTTAGTDNIAAISQTAQAVHIIQMLFDFGFIGFVVAIVIGAVSGRVGTQPVTAVDNHSNETAPLDSVP